MPSLKQCDNILDGLKQKGLSSGEIRDIKNHFSSEFKRLEADKAAGRVDALMNDAEIMKQRGEVFLTALEQKAFDRKRHAAVNIVVRRNLDTFLADTEAAGFGTLEAFEALMVGSDKVKMHGSRASVDAKSTAIFRRWTNGLLYELTERKIDRRFLKDARFRDDVHAEMIAPGRSNDPEVKEIAELFSQALERARQEANRFGFNINRLDGYAPQSHDSIKIFLAGEEKWLDGILPKLDVERSFPDITPGDTAAVRERLRYAYKHITTGRSRQDSALYTAGKDITAKSGAHRTLFFKDADASVAYHAEFGNGGIQDAVFNQLRSLSRGVALIQTFGPNPEMMITSLINARLETFGNSAADVKAYHKLRRAWSGGRGGSGRIDRYFGAITGDINIAVNPRMAQIANIVRKQQSLAKLGGATLSAIVDIFIKAQAIRFRGDNLLSAYSKALGDFYVKGMGSAKGKDLKTLMLIGAYSDAVTGSMAARFDGGVGTPLGRIDGFLARSMDLFFKASFLTQWTEAHKAGYMMGLAKELGIASDKSFTEAFDADMQVVMRRHGVDENRWEMWRKLSENSGETFGVVLIPEKAHQLPEKDFLPLIKPELQPQFAPKGADQAKYDAMRRNAIARERDKLETEVMAFYADETKYAVIEPDAKTQALMTMGTQRGTATGEAVRFMAQFKSFPITYMQRILGESRWRRAADPGGLLSPENFIGVTQFAMGSLVFGYLAMTAKDAAKGKEPRDVDKKETWFAAAMQGGGAGILGDFLFEPVNRFGGGFVDTLAGPTAGTVGDVFRAVQNVARGNVEDAGSDALRTFLDNFPGINLWQTRAALDYFALYHVREMLSPGSMRRMEQRIKNTYGQDYFLPPSQVIKRGGGFK